MSRSQINNAGLPLDFVSRLVTWTTQWLVNLKTKYVLLPSIWHYRSHRGTIWKLINSKFPKALHFKRISRQDLHSPLPPILNLHKLAWKSCCKSAVRCRNMSFFMWCPINALTKYIQDVEKFTKQSFSKSAEDPEKNVQPRSASTVKGNHYLKTRGKNITRLTWIKWFWQMILQVN